jgi:hypothetical protein
MTTINRAQPYVHLTTTLPCKTEFDFRVHFWNIPRMIHQVSEPPLFVNSKWPLMLEKLATCTLRRYYQLAAEVHHFNLQARSILRYFILPLDILLDIGAQ